MDATLLCLLKDYETAKEVPRHIDRLNKKIVELVDNKLSELLSDNWEIIYGSLDEDDAFTYAKQNWIDEDCLACISFEADEDEDDYDYWLNKFLGYSKFPLNININLGGLLKNGFTSKQNLIADASDLKEILISNGFSEYTKGGKNAYCFDRPVIFNKNQLVEALENDQPSDGLAVLDEVVNELNKYVPLIDEIINKFKN